MSAWNPTVFGKNLPTECRQKISDFQELGHQILCVAFPPPGGNRWSVITNKSFFNRNIPEECNLKMMEFHSDGHKVLWVAFPPAGGWSLITNKTFFNRGIPTECQHKMVTFLNANARPICVSFPPAGGNRWSVITNKGTFFNRGISIECHEKMKSFGEKVVSVTYPFTKGNSYTIIGEHGRFFNRNTPTGCHRVMRAMNNCGVGALSMVGYQPSGAFAIVSDASPAGRSHPVLSSGNKTFSLNTFAAKLKTQLDESEICKYGFVVRYKSAMRACAKGPKRTIKNPPQQEFSVFDWFNLASVTKTITAVALLQTLVKSKLTIDEKIYKWLPPVWNIPDSFKTISVKELLNHTSGIRLTGHTYAELKTVAEAGIMLEDKDIAMYKNSNYQMVRIVTAYLAGHKYIGNQEGMLTARRFITYCQTNILDPLGIPGVAWKAVGDDPTVFYPQPPGNSTGTTYLDWTLIPGAAGVHLSLAELSIFLDKLTTTNVLLPKSMRAQMYDHGLGLAKFGSGKSENFRKRGYFPGKKNGGAQLHSGIYSFTNGVQLTYVINTGVSSKTKLDIMAAYNDSWS